jgi:hypothetical protein
MKDFVDSGSLSRSVRILRRDGGRITGVITQIPEVAGWQFTPDRRWRTGLYRIKVRADLEDISGNSAQSAFEAIAGLSGSSRAEVFSLMFAVGED